MLSWCCFLIWVAYYRMFLAQDIICVIIFKSLLQQLFFFSLWLKGMESQFILGRKVSPFLTTT